MVSRHAAPRAGQQAVQRRACPCHCCRLPPSRAAARRCPLSPHHSALAHCIRAAGPALPQALHEAVRTAKKEVKGAQRLILHEDLKARCGGPHGVMGWWRVCLRVGGMCVGC